MATPQPHRVGLQANPAAPPLVLAEDRSPEQHRRFAHIPGLDGLRAVAILLVLGAHINLEFGGSFAGRGLSRWFSHSLAAGWAGVDLFFVLSGFLITGILLEARGSKRYFRSFYSRRILRVFPLYFGYLLTAFLLLTFVPPLRGLFGLPSAADKLSLLLFFYNVHSALAGATLSTFHVFWSLAIEEQFYLAWPLVVLLCSPSRLARVCVALVLISLAGRIVLIQSGAWYQSAYLLTPCRLDGLAIGALIAIARRDPAIWARVSRWARPVFFASAAVLAVIAAIQGHLADFIDPKDGQFPVRGDSSAVLQYGLTALALLFGSALVGVINAGDRSWTKRILESAPLRSVGRYSYGMYVLHTPIIIVLLTVADAIPAGRAMMRTLPPFTGKVLLFAVSVTFVYAVAFLSYNLYERRFLALKKHVEY